MNKLYNDHTMPRIILKHKSPDFADQEQQEQGNTCDMPYCQDSAQHKAPKHRGLNEYFHFCYTHIVEYNKAWDFFSGMSERDIEKHMEKSFYGDRPTWDYNAENGAEEKLREKVNHFAFDEDHTNHNKHEEDKQHIKRLDGPEYEAMAIMGLEPPVTLSAIKDRYKKLAKKHHPDLNRDNPKAEEQLKKINMSYTILKLAYEQYSHLDES